MSPLDSDSTLVVGRIRRSVAFFVSGPDSLYGSVYEPDASATLPPVVLTPSWGNHLVATVEFAHRLAARLAEAGGAALVYHPPGLGDSAGDPRHLSLERLANAVQDAAGYLAERTGRAPHLAGIRLGALPVAVAGARAGEGSLLLIQPLVEPAVAAGAFRAVGAADAAGEGLSEEIAAAVAGLGFAGSVMAVHYATPPVGELPPNVERIVVPGDWRHRDPHAADLAGAMVTSLRSGETG